MKRGQGGCVSTASGTPNEVMMEQVRAQQRHWLTYGTHKPFGIIMRWMAYGKGFWKGQWHNEGKRVGLRYVEQPVKIIDFLDVVNMAMAEAEAILDMLMFVMNRDTYYWSRVLAFCPNDITLRCSQVLASGRTRSRFAAAGFWILERGHTSLVHSEFSLNPIRTLPA